MIIKNSTKYKINAALRESVLDYPVEGLTVEVKYTRSDSKKYMTGTYYRRAKGFENGKLIRLRINPKNKYPLSVWFKTSQYERRRDKNGGIAIIQKMREEKMMRAEDLILAVFLHEFSHYLDHIEGRNGRYKETKADKFALSALERLGVIPPR